MRTNSYWWVGWLLFSFGCLLSVWGIGVIINPIVGVFGGGGGWILLYISLGWREIKQQETVVIERFGQFLRILKPGISIVCLPGLIDKEKKTISLQSCPLTLYKDEPHNKIDFKNGSAQVIIKVYKHIDITNIDENVWRNAYVTDDPDAWLEDTLDDIIRPQLQEMTLDEAQVKKDAIAKSISSPTTTVNDGTDRQIMLVHMIRDQTGYILEKVLITDINLSKEDEHVRRQSLEGEKRGDNFNQTLKMLVRGFKDTFARDPSHDELKDLQQQTYNLISLETIKNSGSNISFVGKDIGSIMPTINVGGNTNIPN